METFEITKVKLKSKFESNFTLLRLELRKGTAIGFIYTLYQLNFFRYNNLVRIEIDQSGKIENTNKPTVIAYSNKESRTILISASDKQTIQKYYRRIGQPKIFVYKLFAVLIYVLIEDKITKIDLAIIDKEYLGYDKLIKGFILEIIERRKKKIYKDIFKFNSIGKKSKAHKIALKSYVAKRANVKFNYHQFKKYV